ncbi:gastrin/cholecystokinin type B receptor-like [Uloborus diversus]|uniref:gastrin/cholecystokinin type B receptor-like n=1 Tax=Uloborus diversus TaxID=327109 RepID=UPI00240914D5|nr:gastrin/cholecystokinin type B receptor-like [Uloborus diversus]
MEGSIRIPLYALIFLSGLFGNILVIITLARNRRLRIVTNVFLLNLAISDLLLGVFCMPITLVGTLLRKFVFGPAMCKIISYVQGVTVAVNAWTMVAISLERYYAVCEPLQSRRWQTSSHACRVVIAIWVMSFIAMAPIAYVSGLLPSDPPGKFKCRESWPSSTWERSFNLILDSILLALPLIVMATAYTRIGLILRTEITENSVFEADESISNSRNRQRFSSQITSTDDCILCKSPKWSMKFSHFSGPTHGSSTRTSTVTSQFHSGHQYSTTESVSTVTLNMNSHNLEHRLAIKKRVTCMLLIVVLEFFICWTPIYVINTIASFDSNFVYEGVGYFNISFFHLLSYVSSCCNPITYCFMNRNFRREFLQTFTRLCFSCKVCKRSSRSNPALN